MILKPEPITSHDQKFHVGPHFNHLDLKSARIPLMISLTLDDTHTSDIGLSYQKGDIVPSFNNLNLPNAMTPLMMPLASHDATLAAMVSHKQKVMLHLILTILT